MRKKIMNYLSVFMLLLFSLTLTNNAAVAQEKPCYEHEDFVIFCEKKKKWFSSDCKPKPGHTCKVQRSTWPDLNVTFK